MKEYPRLLVYKQLPPCEHQRVALPWRVQEVRYPGDIGGFVELFSATVESCWEHVAYRLGYKTLAERRRLVKTLRKH